MESFHYQFQVIESHLDTFGHVNNATYLTLFEQARWDFISDRGWGLEDIQRLRKGPVILEARIKFKRELKNREKITITSQCGEPLNKLVMTMNQKMLKEDDTLAATLELSVGLMDLEKRKLIEPTPEWLHAVGMV